MQESGWYFGGRRRWLVTAVLISAVLSTARAQVISGKSVPGLALEGFRLRTLVECCVCVCVRAKLFASAVVGKHSSMQSPCLASWPGLRSRRVRKWVMGCQLREVGNHVWRGACGKDWIPVVLPRPHVTSSALCPPTLLTYLSVPQWPPNTSRPQYVFGTKLCGIFCLRPVHSSQQAPEFGNYECLGRLARGKGSGKLGDLEDKFLIRPIRSSV